MTGKVASVAAYACGYVRLALPDGTFKEFFFMRSFLTRLALVGIVGIALVGCGSSNGTTLPGGAIPGGAGGGPVNITPSAPVAGSIPDSGLLDDGSLTAGPGITAPGTLSGFNVVGATDVQAAPDGGLDNVACVTPCQPAPTDTYITTINGYHQLTWPGNNSNIVELRYNPVGRVMPSLVYTFVLAPGSFFTYSTLIAHWSSLPSGSLPTATSVSLELVGNGTSAGPGTLVNTYDVRVTCSQPAAPPANVFAAKCGPLPAYGSTTGNTAGPAAVVPGAAGAFTPYNYTLYVEANYAAPTDPTKAAVFAFLYVYGIQ